jgi:hypothetical protein
MKAAGPLLILSVMTAPLAAQLFTVRPELPLSGDTFFPDRFSIASRRTGEGVVAWSVNRIGAALDLAFAKGSRAK